MMWLWSALWRASALLLVSGTLNIGIFSQKRSFLPTAQMNCYEYSKLGTPRISRAHSDGWRSRKLAMITKRPGHYTTLYPTKFVNMNAVMSRRMDKFFPKEHDLVKEHAKLVQDINSLKQVVFVAPFTEPEKDYDDSIFHEIIETSSTTTTTPRLTTPRVVRPAKPTSFPVIYVGGESTRQVVRSQPLTFPKSPISLVGTTGLPLLKHPYPFVMQSSDQKPLRLCMPTVSSYPTTTRQPTLWERLLRSIIPR